MNEDNIDKLVEEIKQAEMAREEMDGTRPVRGMFWGCLISIPVLILLGWIISLIISK